jgi:RHH-type proline utilization regulon transcriptional repressor/proline dehydrogenase/delta 1-pyrroline-5-carboxylate dehydrogenase
MHLSPHIDTDNPLRNRIRQHYRADEADVINSLLPLAELDQQSRLRVDAKAVSLAGQVRQAAHNGGSIQNLLNEYALSTNEGIVLMCLAEALLRVPDKTTADRLIRDKLMSGDWASHLGGSDSLFVNASSWGLLLSGRVVKFNQEEQEQTINGLKKTIGRLGEPLIRQAMRQAMGVMGSQFVLGRTIDEATKRAAKEEARGFRYSYDMLGEAARTLSDADGYYQSYKNAIEHIGRISGGKGIYNGAGISVKLSAIHPRYEFAQSERVMTELVARLKSLALLAKQYDLGFTIDAEEADRLDLSLDIIETVFSDPDLDGWEGFGIVVQAYQKRAMPVLEWVIDLSRRVGRKMMLRLVKGAYWDTEIKLAQVDGLGGYPVYTRKASTDVSYQACAGLLLDNRDVVFPQFATHNAYSVAYILERAGNTFSGFEFQRLHGMGNGLYDNIIKDEQIPVRIYAPVGEHENLLAYLVRRLLENGANSSFVNHIVDESVSLASLVEDPVVKVKGWASKSNPNIPLPVDLYGASRDNSQGVDLTDIPSVIKMATGVNAWVDQNVKRELQCPEGMMLSTSPTDTRDKLGLVAATTVEDMPDKLRKASEAYEQWSNTPVAERSECLRRLGDKLEQHMDEFIALCTKEAGKIAVDGVAEVREAVDFCRYYANEGHKVCSPHPEWESDGQLQSRGVVVCISPWNFPLAIFLGQITAALAAGNTVLAKPADTTCLIAARALELMAQCGFPENVVQLVVVPGRQVGEHLLPDPRVAAVMFTGSTEIGAWISQKLAARPGPRIPLIAETGGQNCMIVDSTALPEQVVDDVISSGFQSAGQRCSALRVLFLQEDIADDVIAMIIGAMKELTVGDPSYLRTDVGPVIDQKALSALQAHVDYMATNGRLLYQCELLDECAHGTYFAPRLYEIDNIGVLQKEVFGPVVHIVRYQADKLDQALADVNSTGFGLTSGVHSRIYSTTDKVVNTIDAGNIYVNRNTIGAVVGVQPFGGHGLSGTGPKAGGPSYVYRLAKQECGAEQGEKSGGVEFNFANCSVNPANSVVDTNRPMTVNQRAEKVKSLIALLLDSNDFDLSDKIKTQIDVMATEAAGFMSEPSTLPGPTGELNQLLIKARGKLLCVDQGNGNWENSIRQICAALLCGNSVSHISDQRSDISPYLAQVGLDQWYQRLAVNSQAQAEALLADSALKGVAASAPQAMIEWLDRALAKREGALTPLIVESNGPAMMHRFVVEKVVSNNTTASGGNTALLTMSDA